MGALAADIRDAADTGLPYEVCTAKSRHRVQSATEKAIIKCVRRHLEHGKALGVRFAETLPLSLRLLLRDPLLHLLPQVLLLRMQLLLPLVLPLRLLLHLLRLMMCSLHMLGLLLLLPSLLLLLLPLLHPHSMHRLLTLQLLLRRRLQCQAASLLHADPSCQVVQAGDAMRTQAYTVRGAH